MQLKNHNNVSLCYQIQHHWPPALQTSYFSLLHQIKSYTFISNCSLTKLKHFLWNTQIENNVATLGLSNISALAEDQISSDQMGHEVVLLST